MIKIAYNVNEDFDRKIIYKLLGFYKKIIIQKAILIGATILAFIVSAYIMILDIFTFRTWFVCFVLLAITFFQIERLDIHLKKSTPKLPYDKAVIEFHEDKYIVRKTGDEFCNITECGYMHFEKAVETDDYFCWLHNNHAFLIEKNEIVEGTPEELRELFKQKLGSRFTVKS